MQKRLLIARVQLTDNLRSQVAQPAPWGNDRRLLVQPIAFTERRESVVRENDAIVLHEDVRGAQRHVIDGLLVKIAHCLRDLSGVLHGEIDRDGIVTDVNGFEEGRAADPARCKRSLLFG